MVEYFMDVNAPTQFITAPPNSLLPLPATVVAVYTAWLFNRLCWISFCDTCIYAYSSLFSVFSSVTHAPATLLESYM